MSVFSKFGSEIFRDYVTPGVSSSGAATPDKSDIRAWTSAVEIRLDELAAVSNAIYRADVTRRVNLFNSAI